MANGEMRGFVFSVVFIIVFSTLLSSIPVGLQGPELTVETVIPVNPNLLSDFTDSENYTRTAFTGSLPAIYDYDLGSWSWRNGYMPQTFLLGAKVLLLGFLWLGGMDFVKFTSDTGLDRGTDLTFVEMEADADNGTCSYTLQFTSTGNAAGGFIVYWNTTLNSDPEDAWDDDVLYLLHGVGIETTAMINIGSLIVSLLLLQLPQVPTLVNVFLAVPIWACIIFVVWFIIKEMIPFL